MPALSLLGKQKPYVMAHRGNRALLPENTLIAFQRAIVDGADILETDLHRTRDGVLVCIHDSTVDRTTDGHGQVASMSLGELRMLNAAPNRQDVPPQRIPTLMELAAILPPAVALALELKTDRFLEPAVCRQLRAELEQAGIIERVVVLSFSIARIRAVKAEIPDLPIGLIFMSRYLPPSQVEMSGPFFPWLFANPLYTLLAHRRGQLVCPLDINPDRRLWYYKLLGCDAVLTDNPDATVKALGRK